ncbi:unnamed protein product, partial [marine sediment metagenome]
MVGVNPADGAGTGAHGQRLGRGSATEVPYALQQLTGADPGGGEKHVITVYQ